MDSHPPFYGKEIDVEKEKQIIEKLLKKYLKADYSEELKEKIYLELTDAKASGVISVPFSVVTRKDESGVHKPYIEILLDTKL